VRALPENSIASFDLALQHGCDGFEFDVRMTADAQAVICHDPRIGSHDVARSRRDELTDLCCLEDVLARYRHKFLDIELKVPGLDDLVLAALQKHSVEKYVVSSFLPEVLTSLAARNAAIPLGFICDRDHESGRWRQLPVQYVIPHFKLVEQELVRDVHAAGKKILTWTVNDRERMQRLAEWGVDGIISDDTELLVKTLHGKG
jgi:glycerophosphoryl diester phosphodiesterase